MPKYLCIQRSPSGDCEKPSPAQMEAMFAKFQSWKDKYKDNIFDMGAPLKPGGKIVSSEAATDGPFVESKEIIGGYMIISAETLEKAIEVVQESPGVGGPGSTVEVREMKNMS